MPADLFLRHFPIVLLLAAGLSACAPIPPLDPIPRQYGDTSLFLSAIKQTDATPLDVPVHGITVPHHLLARDLIADTFAMVSGNDYDRVILLSPDHFFLGTTDITVSVQPFDTVFGVLEEDPAVFGALRELPFVSTGSFLYKEHGIGSLTPFVKYHFPDATFSAVTFKGLASREELRAIADRLKTLLGPRTLVVQSTDFSHYLNLGEAIRKDQETLNVIAGGNADAVLTLNQPDHMDSLEAQWMQMTLQKEIYDAVPIVIRNKNSQEYAEETVEETTSYLTQVFTQEPVLIPASDSYVFAGDTLLGRGMTAFASDQKQWKAFASGVRATTSSAALILNLEGVVMDTCPETADPWKLCMETANTVPVLKELNVRVVGVANNHARDFGDDAYAQSVSILRDNGFLVLERDTVLDLGDFRLAGFTDVDNTPEPTGNLLYGESLQRVLEAKKPVIAFVHWGDEYATQKNTRQHALSTLFTDAGAALVVGAHSHTAVPLSCTASSCVLPSLGNFLFDQFDGRSSGQMLEVTFFPQGTFSVRTLPLPAQ